MKSKTSFRVFFLKQHRKNSLKNIFFPSESVFLDFSFLPQGHRTWQNAHCALVTPQTGLGRPGSDEKDNRWQKQRTCSWFSLPLAYQSFCKPFQFDINCHLIWLTPAILSKLFINKSMWTTPLADLFCTIIQHEKTLTKSSDMLNTSAFFRFESEVSYNDLD